MFSKPPNAVLERWNSLSDVDAASEALSCCGSSAWARSMASARPYSDVQELLDRASEVWRGLGADDWMEAFRSHPRIGERHAEKATTAVSAEWSEGEQHDVQNAEEAIKQAIADGNRLYEERFGRIYIVCATGKRPAEILEILSRRLRNDDETELQESASEQEKILQLRLKKWLKQEGA
ncbi:MAG: 2-oxo-4-hydroxy-4-carboxy-5-ureidoimidazoline decarboxylase [Acidobacteria bacterium]|nr:2-oxo-4-hydroxy-4-carboxy-5-ureidoimidazoline decarboxylase [Acidobacteriota bacterium]